jgi:hypothetical protein
LCALSLHAILARMALTGAAHRAHSSQMHRISASTGLGGITSTVLRSSSTWRCCAAASSWHRLSLANTGTADAVVSHAPMAVSFSPTNTFAAIAAVRLATFWHCISLANAKSIYTVACSGATTKSAKTAACSTKKRDIAPWLASFPPTLHHDLPPPGNNAHW